jgi:hypothetical protein
MGKIHHITYASGNSRANGIPYETTQKMLIESIQENTKREVVPYTIWKLLKRELGGIK